MVLPFASVTKLFPFLDFYVRLVGRVVHASTYRVLPYRAVPTLS